MPTYEYKCETCSHYFEIVQSMMDNALKKCPQCDGPIRRLISKNIGISFKGSGFYANDSSSKSSAPEVKP